MHAHVAAAATECPDGNDVPANPVSGAIVGRARSTGVLDQVGQCELTADDHGHEGDDGEAPIANHRDRGGGHRGQDDDVRPPEIADRTHDVGRRRGGVIGRPLGERHVGAGDAGARPDHQQHGAGGDCADGHDRGRRAEHLHRRRRGEGW